MLPKKEKNSKNSPEQLNLVQKVDNEERQKKNRRIVTFLLVFTVLLSLGFWVYRSAKKILQSNPTLSLTLPRFSFLKLSSSAPVVPDQILPDLPSSWSVVASLVDKSTGQKSYYQFPKNHLPNQELNFDTLISQLQAVAPLTDTSFFTDLPDGITIRQIITTTSTDTQYHYLIDTPSKSLFVWFTTPPVNDPKTNIPALAPFLSTIYWSMLSGR